MAERVLAAVERTDGSGALVVGKTTVYVEDARVCWAATAGLEHRLRELLRGGDRGAALRQHTIESLLALSEDAPLAWEPHTGYRAQHTFAPLELLLEVDAFLYQREAASADLSFVDGDAVSFVVSDDNEALPVRANRSMSLHTVRALGAWVTAAFEATRGFSYAVMTAAVASAREPVAVGWRTTQRLVHAGVFADPSRALADLQQRSYPAVLSLKWKQHEESYGQYERDVAEADGDRGMRGVLHRR